MARATQFTIGWCMIAIAIIGYFCAFPELAVLLGIFTASLLFVSPVLVVPYFAPSLLATNRQACRLSPVRSPQHAPLFITPGRGTMSRRGKADPETKLATSKRSLT